MNFTTTPLYADMVSFYVNATGKVDPSTGRPALPKIYNQGSSRSSKTFTAVQMIVTIFNHNQNRDLYCAVVRDTLVDCRKYTFKDFKEALSIFGLLGNCTIVEFPNPKIKLWGNTIEFMGLPEQHKQAPRTDIVFFNEATEIFDRTRVRGLVMRCEMLCIFDWNPSYSSHWVFDGEKEFNAYFSRTTYLDNPFLTDNIISNIEASCPWDFSESVIEKVGVFKKRRWLKPEEERTPNYKNIEANTADRWYWLVYGEGIPAAREGAIFPHVEWISQFPLSGYDEVVLGVDFGYKVDPSTLNRIGRSGMELTIENMVCQPTETPEIAFEAFYDSLCLEEQRRKSEGVVAWDELWICCDSADKYGTEAFVDSLNLIAGSRNKNWNFFKISKISIAAGVGLMQRFKLHCVGSPRFEIEQQNYVYKMYKGESTNEPDPDSKFNHIWDGVRYAVQHNFYWAINANKR